MILSRRSLLTLLTVITFGSLYAQESVNTSGGTATGDGTVGYSVGQVVYQPISDAGGSVSPGVQQAFDLSIITSVGALAENIELAAYPNPTADKLTLSTVSGEGFNYQLLDSRGTLLGQDNWSGSAELDLSEQPIATYMLNVLKNGELVKAFRIVKN